MNIVEQVCLWDSEESFGYKPRSGITGSWSINYSQFSEKHQIDFQSGCTILHSPSSGWVFYLLSSACAVLWVFNLSHSDWCEVICIFLMTKDFEHFFKCFLAIGDSSVEKSLFSSVPNFLIWLFGVLPYSFLSSLHILDISPLSDVGLVNIFSQFVGCCLS